MTEPPSIATQILEMWGARVTQLPPSLTDECDLLAELGGVRLLVEEKSKLDDPRDVQAREAALARGEVHGSVLPLRNSNRISGIVRKATKQLSSTGASVAHDLRIVWFTGIGLQAEAKHFQFMSTLYGSTRIFALAKPQMRTCYFFRNSDFYRYRDYLDGAVAAYLSGDTVTIKLCLNPHANGWQALRASPYARNFKLGLIDPVAEEAEGEAYIVDGDISRADEYAVIQSLEKKYGLTKLQSMDMNMASAVVRIPNEG
jgi:hypothetical protein